MTAPQWESEKGKALGDKLLQGFPESLIQSRLGPEPLRQCEKL